MKTDFKYLGNLAVICVVMLVAISVFACNENPSSDAASWKAIAVSNAQSLVLYDQDSVGCYPIYGLVFMEDGRIDAASVKKSVYKNIHKLTQGPIFVEIFSTESNQDFSLYNLEVLRREFIRAGFDPVLVATRKTARKFDRSIESGYGFSLILADGYVSGQ